MFVLAWVMLGLVGGVLASKTVNRTRRDAALDVLLGIAGAVIGGGLFCRLSTSGDSGGNLGSFWVAAAGATLVLSTYHALFTPRH